MDYKKKEEIEDVLDFYQNGKPKAKIEDLLAGFQIGETATDQNMFISACRTDNVNSLKNLWNIVSLSVKKIGFEIACISTSKDVLKYYLQMKEPGSFNIKSGLRLALNNESCDTIMFLLVLYPIKTFPSFKELFIEDCQNGNKKALRCSLQFISSKSIEQDYIDLYIEGFKTACNNIKVESIESFIDDRSLGENNIDADTLNVKKEIVIAKESSNETFAELLMIGFQISPISQEEYNKIKLTLKAPNKIFKKPTKFLRQQSIPISNYNLMYPERANRNNNPRDMFLDARRSHSRSPTRSRYASRFSERN